MKFTFKEDGKRIVLVSLGAVLYAFNLKSFVQAGNMLPGGLSGITVLIQQISVAFFDVILPYSGGKPPSESDSCFDRHQVHREKIYVV